MEKKLISIYDAQRALRNSGLQYARAIANRLPELVKIQGKNLTFYFYWKNGNYAYNPETGLCGFSQNADGNLNYLPAQIGDSNVHLCVVETPYGLAVKQK